MRDFLLLLVLILLLAPAAFADIFRPAYLQLTQTAPDRYDVLWKVPALDETTTLKVRPEFPDGTVVLHPQHKPASRVAQRCNAGASQCRAGSTASRSGLRACPRQGSICWCAWSEATARCSSSASCRQARRSSPPGLQVRSKSCRTYTVLGIEHILSGFDHLLFVLSLVLIVRGTRRLIWTVTAFTLAHSITLALATMGVIHVPGPPVEAIIALSIVFVANEIIHQQRGTEGLAARKPWLIAFTFGLLHGLGFAGALARSGLAAELHRPRLAVLQRRRRDRAIAVHRRGAGVRGSGAAGRRARRQCRSGGDVVLAYCIGGTASYWVIERIAAF